MTIIITSRSTISEEKKLELIRVGQNEGTHVEFLPCDVSMKDEVKKVIRIIKDRFGSLTGIFHCAGLIQDALILNKTREEVQNVFAPKVDGLLTIDKLTQDEPLDFIVLFSSISGIFGSIGQADYAGANTFLDAYAHYRNELVKKGQRRGNTLSICWPLWQEGGMHVDKTAEKSMLQRFGAIPMDTLNGIRALFQALASNEEQVIVMEGNGDRIRKKHLGDNSPSLIELENVTEESKSTFVPKSDNLVGKIQASLKKLVSAQVNVKVENLDGDKEFGDLGFDSITFTTLGNKLNEAYGLRTNGHASLVPTIFFEYPTINSFANFLAEEYRDVFQEKFISKIKHDNDAVTIPSAEPLLPFDNKHRPRFARSTEKMNSASRKNLTESGDVAIVGMSGCFPMANDVNAFWQNLVKEKTCISEIPQDRWDWRKYYGDPAKEENKTNIKWGGFIDGVGDFDPLFFGITPMEASQMDPHHRLLMSHVWLAVEDAGYNPFSLSGTNTAIFVGIGSSGYNELIENAGIGIGGKSMLGILPSVGPNRMSYFLNLHGPSESIDTACSSSLVAIHRAVMAMRNGNCEMAVVGAVQAIVSPFAHISFSKAGMLSEEGRCFTFSSQANGYVRGEGVGMLFLKKLGAAEKARDHIYGLIKGTAVNHGGHANTLTSPNTKAQKELLVSAYTEANIDPKTVSYIEAHGTGTPLGDPIEINSLKGAFKELNQASGKTEVGDTHCGLGSVKTNIGHLELAAGIAGLIKVLLQLQHRTLARSLHCKKINLYIDLKESPFYVVQETQEWKALEDDHGRSLPRRAGVSSFGFGGVNAHVVIEEYVEEEKIEDRSSRSNSGGSPALREQKIDAKDAYLIVLSAKNEDRLKKVAKNLYVFLTASRQPPIPRSGTSSAIAPGAFNLQDVAYTLQVGREGMEERLAVIVGSVEELKEKLKDFLEGQDGIEDLYRGKVKRNKGTSIIFMEDEDIAKAINAWVTKGKYAKLMGLWVKGLSFDWNKLYQQSKPRRISLPTYPFNKERYWVEENTTKPLVLDRDGTTTRGFKTDLKETFFVSANYLHPLLHHNTSDLEQQQFTSVFNGKEFFLSDHVIIRRNILPGVAYLEMARAAAEISSKEGVVSFRDVVWMQPIIVEGRNQEVVVNIYPDSSGIFYKIYTGSGPREDVVHSQGMLVLNFRNEPRSPPERPPKTDIGSIKALWSSAISGDSFYDSLKKKGGNYGPAFKSIETIYKNEKEVLARLRLPKSRIVDATRFYLHPSIMDAAFQLTDSLLLQPEAIGKFLPFFVKTVEIYGSTPQQGYAHVYFSSGGNAQGTVVKYDIDILSVKGEVCVSFKEFTTRPEVIEALESDILYLTEQWTDDISRERIIKKKVHPENQIFVMSAGMTKEITEKIETNLRGDANRLFHIDHLLGPSASNTEVGIKGNFELVFDHIQKIIQSQSKETHRILVLIPSDYNNFIYAPLVGLFKTASLEHRRIQGKVISVEGLEESGPNRIIKILRRESQYDGKIVEILYDLDDRRKVKRLAEVELKTQIVSLKESGVYWITGGFGKLGMILAKHLVTMKGLTIILSGRSSLSKEKKLELSRVSQKGTRIRYLPCDVSLKDDVEKVLRTINKDYGSLKGIFHCAGLVQDALIVNKTKKEIQSVFAPKINGLLTIDRATQDESLDFMVLFSSISGTFGSIGQADYAGANTFLDAYAHHRNELVRNGQRRGKTLSINWPLWKEGGMHVDEAAEKSMLQNMGIVPMRTLNGIKALYQVLGSKEEQVIVMEGDGVKIRQHHLKEKSLFSSETVKVDRGIDSTVGSSSKELVDRIQSSLKTFLSDQIKVKIEDLDCDREFGDYGLDSITLTTLSNKLNEAYGLRANGHTSLVPIVFFEHPTINSFAKFLADEYRDVFQEKFFSQDETDTHAARIPPVESSLPFDNKHLPRFARMTERTTPASQRKVTESGDIAIVGMSGCFPMARDVDEYWENLITGKDCICEIPKSRWDWRKYYGDPTKDGAKTNSKWGGFIKGVDEFDPLFFRISPSDVQQMDPHHRLLMTYVWLAIEDAGYSPSSLSGTKTAIFVGVGSSAYGELIKQAGVEIGGKSLLGVVPSLSPNRMSYFLNLHGPSEPIETACSSVLVAIHRAVTAMKNDDCEMAIVGGINTMLTPFAHISFSKAGMLANDGRCKTFSAEANGYVRGEGVGMLFLKKFGVSEQAGDHIYGVIKGSATNHGGHANTLTSPNTKAQKELLISAYTKAGIDPRSMSYIEVNGTGTLLGDPIEINGLKGAFEELYQASGKTKVENAHCGLGSVKTNIGHLELASGVAGVIKILLQLKHKTLVKSLHCTDINPYINLKESPFYVVQETQDWKSLEDPLGRPLPRRAGVSSFGFGGVNAHVIMEECPPPAQDQTNPSGLTHQSYLIVLSAKNEDRLREVVKNLHSYLRKNHEPSRKRKGRPAAVAGSNATEKIPETVNLPNLAYTLQVGREGMKERLAVIVESVEELQEKLNAFMEDQGGIENLYRGQVKGNDKTLAVLKGDEEFGETLDKAIRHGNYGKLLDLWVNGLRIDWNMLYGEIKPCRISLPGYPFARKRYWVESSDVEEKDSSKMGVGYQEELAASEESEPVMEWEFLLSDGHEEIASEYSHFATGEKAKLFVQHLLANQLQKPIEEIEPDQNFFHMGLTSYGLVKITQEVINKIDPEFQPTVIFDHPSISALFSYLVRHYTPAINQLTVTKKEIKKDINKREPKNGELPCALYQKRKGIKKPLSHKLKSEPQPSDEENKSYVSGVLDQLESGALSLDEVITLVEEKELEDERKY